MLCKYVRVCAEQRETAAPIGAESRVISTSDKQWIALVLELLPDETTV